MPPRTKPGKPSPLPDFIPPEVATLVNKALEGDEWLHEIKLDAGGAAAHDSLSGRRGRGPWAGWRNLVALAKRHSVPLRQSYIRVAKQASIMVGRYSHAHQFKRARRMLKFLRTRLGRLIRDLGRRIEGHGELEALFIPMLALASRVRHQDRHQRGPKVYALHAPEVECIFGSSPRTKGKARTPLRVRLQGQRGHPRHLTQGRPVCPPCQGAPWEPV
jgi:hypothetical protein